MIYDVPPRIVKILQYHNLINKPRKKLEFYRKYFIQTAADTFLLHYGFIRW